MLRDLGAGQGTYLEIARLQPPSYVLRLAGLLEGPRTYVEVVRVLPQSFVRLSPFRRAPGASEPAEVVSTVRIIGNTYERWFCACRCC